MIREQTHLTTKKIVLRIITVECEYGCGAAGIVLVEQHQLDGSPFLKDDLLYITACTLFQTSRIEG